MKKKNEVIQSNSANLIVMLLYNEQKLEYGDHPFFANDNKKEIIETNEDKNFLILFKNIFLQLVMRNIQKMDTTDPIRIKMSFLKKE